MLSKAVELNRRDLNPQGCGGLRPALQVRDYSSTVRDCYHANHAEPAQWGSRRDRNGRIVAGWRTRGRSSFRRRGFGGAVVAAGDVAEATWDCAERRAFQSQIAGQEFGDG